MFYIHGYLRTLKYKNDNSRILYTYIVFRRYIILSHLARVIMYNIIRCVYVVVL